MSGIVKLCKCLLWVLFWMPKTRIWNYCTMSTHRNSKWRNMTTSKWKAFINKMLNIPLPNDWVQRIWISKEVHPVPYHWCFFKAPVSWSISGWCGMLMICPYQTCKSPVTYSLPKSLVLYKSDSTLTTIKVPEEYPHVATLMTSQIALKKHELRSK